MPNFGGSRPGYWFKRPPRTKSGKVLIVREEVGPSGMWPLAAGSMYGGYWGEADKTYGDPNYWFQLTKYGFPFTHAGAPPRNNGQYVDDKRIFYHPRVYQDATVTETGTRIELTGRPWDEKYLKISSQLDDKTPYMSVGKYFEILRNAPPVPGVPLAAQKLWDQSPVWGDHPPSHDFYAAFVEWQNYKPAAQIVASNRTSAQLNHQHQYVYTWAVFDQVGGLKNWGGMDEFGYNGNYILADRYAQITTMKEIAAFLQKAEEQLGLEVTVVKSYEYLYANYTADDLKQFDHIWDIVHGGLSNYRDLGVGINMPLSMLSSGAGDPRTEGPFVGNAAYPNGMKYGNNYKMGEYDEGRLRFSLYKDHPFVKAQRPLTAIIPAEIKTLYKSYLQSGGNIGFINSPVEIDYLYRSQTARLGWYRQIGVNDFINELGGGGVERFPAPHHMNKRVRTQELNDEIGGSENLGGNGIWSPFDWNEAYKKNDFKNAARVTTGGFVNNKYYPSPKWYLNSEFFIDNSKREVDLQSVSSWSYKNGKLNIGTGTPVIVGKMEPTDETITSLNAKNFNYCCAALWKRGSMSEAPQGSIFVINNLHWVVDVDLKYPTDYNSLWTTTQKDPVVVRKDAFGGIRFRWVQDAYQKIVDPLYRKFRVWGSRKRDEENFLNLLQIFEKS